MSRYPCARLINVGLLKLHRISSPPYARRSRASATLQPRWGYPTYTPILSLLPVGLCADFHTFNRSLHPSLPTSGLDPSREARRPYRSDPVDINVSTADVVQLSRIPRKDLHIPPRPSAVSRAEIVFSPGEATWDDSGGEGERRGRSEGCLV